MPIAYYQKSGSGATVSEATIAFASPNNPTITGVSIIDITRASDGRPQKRITVTYTPPAILGTFTGVNVYLDHPDSSGTVAIADGTQAADGTIAAAGGFAPDNIGPFPYDANNPSVVFEVDPPTWIEYWRVYLAPLANNTQVPVIQFGLPGASASYQFLASPPASSSAGREFAPLVVNPALSSIPGGWGANPHVAVAASGDQYFEFRVTWGWPTFDQNFQTVGGVNIVLDDGASRKVIGQVWMPPGVVAGTASVEADALFASGHITVQPGTKNYKVILASFNKSGQVNTYVEGRTPEIDFSITRNTGTAGQEYCGLVTSDGVHALVTVAAVAGADGTSLIRVTGYFTPPPDPAFGSVDLVVDKGDGVKRTIKSGRLTPIEVDISQPATVQSWIFYLRSVDINGLRNTITGSTPQITLSVGNASGVLNLAKAAGSSFSSEFQIVGGVFKVLNLSAASIVTGILQVGFTGSQVSQMKVFDTVGSIIGFWGDDTGGTGYVGLWAKQARIGGTGPSTAPIQADSSGNVTITGASIKITNFGGSGIVTDITQAFDSTTGFNYGLQIKNNSNNERIDFGYNQIYMIDNSNRQQMLLGGNIIALGDGTGTTSASVSLSGSGFSITISKTGFGVNAGLSLDGSNHGQLVIEGNKVVSTKVTSTPATLADVIAVLQHHGLSN